MALTDDLRWFKDTFHEPVAAATAGTPFGRRSARGDCATGVGRDLGASCEARSDVDELLELCVGDFSMTTRGDGRFRRTRQRCSPYRAATKCSPLPTTRSCAWPFTSGLPALPRKKAHKFCRGFGIFQYDLQFFKVDPEYFLQRRWHHFDLALGRCVGELQAAQKRIGLAELARH